MLVVCLVLLTVLGRCILYISSLFLPIGEKSSSSLMKVAIESPEKLVDKNLEEIVYVWNRKGGKIAV